MPAPAANLALSPAGRVLAFFRAAADAAELWLVDSGALDQLAFLIAKTGLARNAVLWAASYLTTRGLLTGSPSEAVIGALVSVLVATVNGFIAHVRNKYAARLQHTVGVQGDKFIGPETVAEVARLVIRDANAPSQPLAPPSSNA